MKIDNKNMLGESEPIFSDNESTLNVMNTFFVNVDIDFFLLST